MTRDRRRAQNFPVRALARRAMLKTALSAGGAAMAPDAIRQLLGSGAAMAGTLPVPAHRTRLITVSDIVLPATPTAQHGAAAASALGVPDFVLLAAAHGLAGATPATLGSFAAALDHHAGGAFLAAPAPRQRAALTRLDEATFAAPRPGQSAWGIIKSLILMGYYTSEQGGTVELHYDLVPGHYDGNIACPQDAIAYSSDWTGTSFK